MSDPHEVRWVDPHDAVVVGTRVADIAGSREAITGFLVPGSYCGVSDPERHGWVCTREQDHPRTWKHIAANSTQVVAVWGPDEVRTIPGVEVGTDGTAHVGDDPDQWCAAIGATGWMCTRPNDHTHEHIAVDDGGFVMEVWGSSMTDPFASIRRRHWATDQPGWDNPHHGLHTSRTHQCGTRFDNVSGVCTRPTGHPGNHIRVSESGEVMWVKVNTVPTEAERGAPMPAADGQTPDTQGWFTPANLPETGAVVRLRNRATRLYVLGMRADGSVETVNLADGTFGVWPPQRLVATSEELGQAELATVVRWFSGHRQEVRKVAVREYRGGRWCRDGLNENLAKLGLEDYQPTLVGEIQVKIPFEWGDIHATASTLESAVNPVLAQPSVIAAIRAAIPPVNRMELDLDHIEIRTANLGRR